MLRIFWYYSYKNVYNQLKSDLNNKYYNKQCYGIFDIKSNKWLIGISNNYLNNKNKNQLIFEVINENTCKLENIKIPIIFPTIYLKYYKEKLCHYPLWQNKTAADYVCMVGNKVRYEFKRHSFADAWILRTYQKRIFIRIEPSGDYYAEALEYVSKFFWHDVPSNKIYPLIHD